MDAALYVAMTGAQQTLVAQAVNANNLANVSTTGFRADLSQFRAMPAFGEALNSRIYALAERPSIDFSPAQLETTGRDLDIAVNGDGLIAVQAVDGTEAYTRAGDLRVASVGGVLETGAGYPVMGDGGPIAIPPFEKLEIGSDGTISIIPLGQAETNLVQLDRIKLVKPPLDSLQKGEDGLIRQANGKPAPADAAVTLVSGTLESSNVNMVDGLTKMIALQRRFEMQMKMMEATKDNATGAEELLKIS
jgi:flagellar basal-body rod protein FlgF